MNYQTVIQFISAKKAEISAYAAELSTQGFKCEAAVLWAEEDELVKRLGDLIAKENEQNCAVSSDLSIFSNIDDLKND